MGRRVVDALSMGAGVEDGRRRWDKAHKQASRTSNAKHAPKSDAMRIRNRGLDRFGCVTNGWQRSAVLLREEKRGPRAQPLRPSQPPTAAGWRPQQTRQSPAEPSNIGEQTYTHCHRAPGSTSSTTSRHRLFGGTRQTHAWNARLHAYQVPHPHQERYRRYLFPVATARLSTARRSNTPCRHPSSFATVPASSSLFLLSVHYVCWPTTITCAHVTCALCWRL